MTYFYARVSTKDQNLDRQMEAAKAYRSIDRVFADKQSGKNFDRPQYMEMKSVINSGDEVVIKELDRLGRDKEGIKSEIKWFKEHGVILRILDVPTTLIDFRDQEWVADMVNNILIEVLGAIAQNERDKNRRRQREGIDAMKTVDGKKVSAITGRTYGRQPVAANVDFEKIAEEQKNGEMTVAECCAQFGISRRTWYNRVRNIRHNNNGDAHEN